MDENKHLEFMRNRITELREIKGVSEYQMSLDLDKSPGYIHNIRTGKSSLSMVGFFRICDYLGISHKDFFDAEIKSPLIIKEIVDKLYIAHKKRKSLVVVLDVLNVVIGGRKKRPSKENNNNDLKQ